MIPFENIKTIFFDYDGTLHNSIKIYAPAFRKAYQYLVEKGLAEGKKYTDEEISQWLGYNSKDMWKAFMPHLDEEIRNKCSNILGQEMQNQINHGNPVLYEGALEVLSYLKEKKYELVFISNCRKYYKDSHEALFQLDEYFKNLVCSQDYDFLPKHKILSELIDQYPKEMVIIGDRKQDIEAGIKNNIYTIGCSYGFSSKDELNDADMIIDDIGELLNYF